MCGHEVYINVEGEVFCKNNCFKPYFIQETRFHCGSEHYAEWTKIEVPDKHIFDLCPIISTVNKKLLKNELDPQFSIDLMSNIKSKWKN